MKKNILKVILSNCIAAMFFISMFASFAAVELPKFPKTGSYSDFIPKGWEVLDMSKGDLNKDDKADYALVLQKTDDEDCEYPRILLVLLNQGSKYKLSVNKSNIIMLANEGGVFGDPLEGIKIERGTLLIRHYGGSSDRWWFYSRFRFQDGGWYHIGQTEGYANTHSNEYEQYDENLINGKTIITTVDKKGTKTEKTVYNKKKKLVEINDYH